MSPDTATTLNPLMTTSLYDLSNAVANCTNATTGNCSMPPGPAADDRDATNPRFLNGIVVLLLLICNVGGNSIVFYVYHSRNTVFALFVRALAALDLLTAFTTMLIDVIMKVRPIDETELNLDVMCKLSHFQVYANSLASGSVLTLIAYQRYRKICHPLKRGISLLKAKVILAVIGLSCTAVCVPVIVVYGPMDIKVSMDGEDGVPVQCTICRYDEHYKGGVLQLVTSYSLFLAFSAVLLTTILLYGMVSRAIRAFERRNSQVASPGALDAASLDIGAVNDRWNFPVESPVDARPPTSLVHGRRPLVSPVNGRPVAAEEPRTLAGRDDHHNDDVGANNFGGGHNYRLSQARASVFSHATSHMISTQTYRVFAVITAVFIVSYLPHLVVLILTKALDLNDKVLTRWQLVFLELAYNCPYISTVANPFVYGFSSSEFRELLGEVCSCYCDCWCCCRRRPVRHSRHYAQNKR